MELERVVAELADKIERRCYGKFRGFVVDTDDPLHLGRLKARVPSLLGPDVVTGWALPCVPYGGNADRGFLFVPEPGAGVWIEFEEGDLEFPIWTGAFWSQPESASELPRPNAADGAEAGAHQDTPTRKIIKTAKGHTLQFEDADDGAMILLIDGANKHVVALDANGICVTDGKSGHQIKLDGQGIQVCDGNHGHEITLDGDGIRVVDGKHHHRLTLTGNGVALEDGAGNHVTTSSGGLTVHEKSGNEIVLSSAGIQVGSSSAFESMVLGTTLALNVASFLMMLNTHTHVSNLPGTPASPPVVPMQLQVPLSPKNKVQ